MKKRHLLFFAALIIGIACAAYLLKDRFFGNSDNLELPEPEEDIFDQEIPEFRDISGTESVAREEKPHHRVRRGYIRLKLHERESEEY